MEALIQNIPVAAALVLPVVLVLMVVTNIIVEVLKKLTWGSCRQISWPLPWLWP